MKTPPAAAAHDSLLNARAEAAARLYSFIASLVISPMDARDLAALVDRIHDLSSGEERAFSFAITDNNHSSLSDAARALRLPSTQPPTWSQQRTRAVGNPHAVRNRIEPPLSAIGPNIADDCGDSTGDRGGVVQESGIVKTGPNLAKMTSPQVGRRAQIQRASMPKSSTSNANPFAQDSLRSILPTDEFVVRSPSVDVFAETRDRIEISMKSLATASKPNADTSSEAIFSYLQIPGGKAHRPVISNHRARRDTDSSSTSVSGARLDRKALSEMALIMLDSRMIETCDPDPSVVEAVALLLWQRVAFSADRIGLCEFCFGVDFLLAQHKKRILESSEIDLGNVHYSSSPALSQTVRQQLPLMTPGSSTLPRWMEISQSRPFMRSPADLLFLTTRLQKIGLPSFSELGFSSWMELSRSASFEIASSGKSLFKEGQSVHDVDRMYLVVRGELCVSTIEEVATDSAACHVDTDVFTASSASNSAPCGSSIADVILSLQTAAPLPTQTASAFVRKVLRVCREGTLVGERGLLRNDQRRTATVEVGAEPAMLLSWTRRDFQTIARLEMRRKLSYRIAFLARLELFANVNPSQLLRIALLIKEETFLPGSFVAPASGLFDSVYFIERGELVVQVPLDRARESDNSFVQVATLRPGMIEGDFGVLNCRSRRASLMCGNSMCSVLKLSGDQFLSLLSADQIQIISSSSLGRASANRKSLASVGLGAVSELYPNSVTLDALFDSLLDYQLSPVSLSVVQRIIERFSATHRMPSVSDSCMESQPPSSAPDAPLCAAPPRVIVRDSTIDSADSSVATSRPSVNAGEDVIVDVPPRLGQSTFVFNSIFPPATFGLHRQVFSPSDACAESTAITVDFTNAATVPFSKNSNRKNVLTNGPEPVQNVAAVYLRFFDPTSLLQHVVDPSVKDVIVTQFREYLRVSAEPPVSIVLEDLKRTKGNISARAAEIDKAVASTSVALPHLSPQFSSILESYSSLSSPSTLAIVRAGRTIAASSHPSNDDARPPVGKDAAVPVKCPSPAGISQDAAVPAGAPRKMIVDSIRTSESPRPTMISSKRHQAARLSELRASSVVARPFVGSGAENVGISQKHNTPSSASENVNLFTDRQHSDSAWESSNSGLSNAIVIKSFCSSPQRPVQSLSSSSASPASQSPDSTNSVGVRLRPPPHDSTTPTARRRATLPRLSARSALVEGGRESALASWATSDFLSPVSADSSLDIRSRPLSSRIGMQIQTPSLFRAVAETDPLSTTRAVQKSRDSVETSLHAPRQTVPSSTDLND